MTDVLLDVDDLHAGYGAKTVLRGISLRLEKARTAVLLGANGAGKSTTLKAIVGAVTRTGGTIALAGEPTDRTDPATNVQRGLALVPEGGRVFADFTVERNLRLGAFSTRKRSDANARMEFVLHTFPVLRERLKQRAGTLSGGERQMLAIGRTLMSDPKVLLLDEPFLGLAPIVIDRLVEAVKGIQRETGVAMLVVEQNPRALDLAHEVLVMRLGEIVLREDDLTELSTPGGMRQLEESLLT
jgi:branched-chain amino acid transport system ATP-binding protein